MIDDHRTLPGYPRKSLVLKVRKALNRYGIRPYSPSNSLNQIWRDTWTWAYDLQHESIERKRWCMKWPTPNEIASQYVFLLLATMRNDVMLSLPYAARKEGRIPAAIAAEYKIPQRSGQLQLDMD